MGWLSMSMENKLTLLIIATVIYFPFMWDFENGLNVSAIKKASKTFFGVSLISQTSPKLIIITTSNQLLNISLIK